MTDHQGQDRPSQPESLEPAVILRAAADDELLPEQQISLQSHLAQNPGDDARISFERELRVSCARVMAAPAAPAGLREKIAARLEADRADDEGGPAPISINSAGVDRFFWTRARRAASMAAAILVLVAVAVVYRQTQVLSYAMQLSSFVTGEHDRCFTPKGEIISKFTIADAADIQAASLDWLGEDQDLDDLGVGEMIANANLTFLGAGRCAVPGQGSSGHLIFESQSDPGRTISLFVQRYKADPVLDESVLYSLKAETWPEASAPIVFWRRGEVVYYLICPIQETGARVRVALNAPKRCLSLNSQEIGFGPGADWVYSGCGSNPGEDRREPTNNERSDHRVYGRDSGRSTSCFGPERA